MRKQIMLLTVLMVCFPLSTVFAGSNYYDYNYARMSYVQGDVYVQRADDLGYEEGMVNLGLIQGDKLGTRDGRTELHLGNRNYLRVNSYTQLDIVGLPDEYEYRVQLHLLSGEVFLRVNNLEREKDIEIHTPDASYYILDNGLYRFHVRDNLETELQVLSGTVEAAAEEGSLLVYAEERLRAANGRFMNDPEQIFASWDDAFYEWNQSRDALHSRRVDRHYLPNELTDYEAELAHYGSWVHEGSLGYVWVPRTTVSHWRPYWNGRWVWYPVIGWTWVSYEPWGWCVSHYGRWHWSGRLGWHWIPTRTWGPAWVHWYHGSHYVGWSPLSYWGYPGVVINNHYYGRYYRDSYPLHSRALTMVRKDQLQDRRISRVSLDSGKIRNVNKISLSSRQPDIRPAVNRNSAKARVAAQALERSKVRTVKSTFSGSRNGGVRSRVDSSRIRNSGNASRVSGTKTRNKRESVSRSSATKDRISSSRSGITARERTGRIKTYPSQNKRSLRRSGAEVNNRERVIPRVSSRSSRKASSGTAEGRRVERRIIPRVSSRSARKQASGTSGTERIKRYPSSSRSSKQRDIRSSNRSSASRNSAVSNRERRSSGVYSRTSGTRRISSSRYTSGSSSQVRRSSSSSSRRSLSTRSSGYIPKSSSYIRSRTSSSNRSSSLSRRSSSTRTRISSPRTSVSRSRGRSVSRSTRSRSSSSARKSSSRSSGTKKRKK